MKTTLGLATAIAGTLITTAAWACGMPFGTGINVDAKQDIIVAHKSGVETYVFQPTFCGTATNFGLILPVPSKLTEQPALASAEVFKYVDSISQPQIVKRTTCTPPRNGMEDGVGTGGGSWGDAGTHVVSSGRVGFLDYAQLKADTRSSFTDWLDANGFPHDTAADDVFSYYVDKGWYFLAFKIANGTTGNYVCNALGPIKMSFSTDTPVVPSRMAQAGGSNAYFTWRIFGITQAGKQIGLAQPMSSVRELDYSGALTAADVTHLDGLAEIGDRLSKLSIWFGGSYSAAAGSDVDVELKSEAAQDFRKVIYEDVYVPCDGGVPDAQPTDSKPSPTDTDTATGTQTSTSTAQTPTLQPNSDQGCSVGAGAGGAGTALPLLVGLALLLRSRRKNR